MIQKISYILKLFGFKYPIYLLSFLMPRNKNKWLVGSYYGFIDNGKYFFLNMEAKKSKINLIYIVNDRKISIELRGKGVNCVYQRSAIGVWHLLTAKVYIGTHGLGWGLPRLLSGGSKYVELWHGTPIKEIGYLDSISGFKEYKSKLLQGLHRLIFYFSPQYSPKDLFIAPSSFVKNLFGRSFKLSDSCFIDTINPRCESFYWEEAALLRMSKRFNTKINDNLIQSLKKFNRRIIYLPTFRDADPDYLFGAGFNFELLNSLMKETNSIFILKLHPRSIIENLTINPDFENILLLPSDIDLYNILPFMDVLVTDYSSVYIDFMHKKNGHTIFFPFDYEKYISCSRGLAFDYDTHISGIRVNSFKELLLAIKNNEYISFDERKKEKLFDFFWGSQENKVDLFSAIKEISNQ